jgi:hypothetical protein
MATKKEEAPGGYATGPDQPGRPVGPEHDSTFHVEEWSDEQNAGVPAEATPTSGSNMTPEEVKEVTK